MIYPIILEALSKSLSTVLLLMLIILPIMIVLEYLSYYNLLQRLTSGFQPLTRSLTLPAAAAFPLLIGLLVGLFYGAAVIIEYSRRGLLQKRELKLLGIFLAINHGIIEDNLIFAALGANFLVLFIVRFILAFLVTRLVGFYLDHQSERNNR